MMGSRRHQRFVAPGDRELPLPIPESPWHVGRLADIPAEHWEILVRYAQKNFPQNGELMEEASYLDGDFSHWSVEKSVQFRHLLEQLCALLGEAEDFTYEDEDEIYEDYTNSAYIRMIQAVMTVVDESLKSSEFFNSYVC
jgi:hypothetical protein